MRMAADFFPDSLQIISGARTPEEQARLEREGRPTAAYDLSTHAATDRSGCARLATGADLRSLITPTQTVKHHFGRAAFVAGLRWGGGSEFDENQIPSDWNHVDLGPRTE